MTTAVAMKGELVLCNKCNDMLLSHPSPNSARGRPRSELKRKEETQVDPFKVDRDYALWTRQQELKWPPVRLPLPRFLFLQF